MVEIKSSAKKSTTIVKQLRQFQAEGWDLDSLNVNFTPSSFAVAYPLEVILSWDTEIIKIRVSSVAAGRRCPGSELLQDILDALGAEFQPEDLFTRKHMNSYGIIHMCWKPDSDGVLVLQQPLLFHTHSAPLPLWERGLYFSQSNREEFEKIFKRHFDGEFLLYTKDEFLNNHMLRYGNPLPKKEIYSLWSYP